MNCRDAGEQIDAYLDGLLPDQESERIESHLADCRACRQEVLELRAILDDAAALPETLRPERDLWPGIEKKMEPVSAKHLEPAGRRWLGFAAAVLVFLMAGYVLFMMKPGSAPPGTRNLLKEISHADAEYSRAKNDLMTMLQDSKGNLDQETSCVIEENLVVIEDAIEEIRTALAADPCNSRLQHRLAETRQQGLRLIALSVRLSQ